MMQKFKKNSLTSREVKMFIYNIECIMGILDFSFKDPRHIIVSEVLFQQLNMKMMPLLKARGDVFFTLFILNLSWS